MTATATENKTVWYAIVHAGSDPAPARGPYRNPDEVDAALGRFRDRYGAMAGTYEAAGSVGVRQYATRDDARNADVSDTPGRQGCVGIGY